MIKEKCLKQRSLAKKLSSGLGKRSVLEKCMCVIFYARSQSIAAIYWLVFFSPHFSVSLWLGLCPWTVSLPSQTNIVFSLTTKTMTGKHPAYSEAVL